jgi:hypothetical protein
MDSKLNGMSGDDLARILNNENVDFSKEATPPTNNEPPAGDPPAGDPPAGDPPANDPPPSNDPPPANDPPAPTMDWTKVGNGRFKSEEEFTQFLSTHDSLQQQLNEARTKGPVFQSEGHKSAYELLSQAHGKPEDELYDMLRIRKLNLESLPGQELRFEAFLRQPDIRQAKNAGVTEDQLRAMFLEDDVKLYGDPNNTDEPPSLTQQTRAQLATNSAKSILQQAQEAATKVVSAIQPEQVDAAKLAQERAEYVNFVTAQISSLNQIGFEAKAKDPDGEEVVGKVNFPIDAARLPQVISAVSDPHEWWEKMMINEGIMDTTGKLDTNKFAKLVAEIIYRKEIQAEHYRQGQEDRTAKLLVKHRNPPKKDDTPPPTPAPKEKSKKEELAEMYWNTAGK